MFLLQVKIRNATGRTAEAKEASKVAKWLNIIGISIGTTFWTVIILTFIIAI